MSEQIELLFFDTFAHENSEELNLDLVQFPKPVYVTEVRIIPLGARVQADFPGGVRLGATNPSQFQIEFFVNDLGKPGASTFESLGGFEYNQNGCINLDCVPDEAIRKIPTDGLVLRGWYTTITLAVYGTLTVNITEQIIPPVVTPSIPAQPNTIADVQQIISASAIETEWPQETIPAVPLEYTQQPATAYPQPYAQPEPYPQDYTDYYAEVPKDPRSYHHTPETDWDAKNRNRPLEVERDRDRDRDRNRDYQKTGSLERDHNDRRDRDRDRCYSRSHSRDRDRSNRDFRETSRERDWDHERQDFRDRDWDRDRYKHQDTYRRSYNREEREERKRPRTPPMTSPKRPHTPHGEHKDLSPPEVECLSEEELNNLERLRKDKENEELAKINKSPPKEVKEVHTPPREEVSQMDIEEFEPILSDEDILDDNEHFTDLDYDYSAYTNNDDLFKLFVPGTTELQTYAKTELYKISKNKIEVDESLKNTIAIADDFFKSSITKYTLGEFEKLNAEIKEEFIHLCEKVMSTVDDVQHFCLITKMHVEIKNFDNTSTYENRADKEVVDQVNFIVEVLLEWLKIALSFDMANAQEQPAYKIRHVKCGVILANWCCNSSEFIQLLWKDNFNMHKVLLDLYNREYMALSIKLMILRALDSYLLKKPAIERFLLGRSDDKKENGFCESISFSQSNGYKTLVELVRKNPLVRVKFALNSILKKLNLYEVLSKLHATLSKLRNCTNVINVDDLNVIVKSLDYISHTCQSGCFDVSQPKRFLPVAAQFEINRCDMKNVLVEYFDMHNLMQCFVLLLAHPKTANLPSVKTSVYEILSELIGHIEGLRYLSKNTKSINLLLKILLPPIEDVHYTLPDVINGKAYNLGLTIALKLQCLYHIDCLFDMGPKFNYDFDTNEIIDQLHALFCLTFTNAGKFACAEVLGFDKNIGCLLQFFDNILYVKDKSESQLSRIKKSPGVGYIIDLLAITVVIGCNVPLLENYNKQLVHLVNQQDLFETTVANKINNEIGSFLKPFEIPKVMNYENISLVVDCISKQIEFVTTFPGQLITSLQIVQYLGIPRNCNKTPVLSESPLSNYIELKYKHVILQLFSLEGVVLLTKILQKICEFFEQPSLHTSTFVSNQGVYIVNTIEPCVQLLKQMLTYVIQCRNTNFKDLTSIPVLLQTYNLLNTLPSSSAMYFKAQKICTDIIETLLAYTQPVSDEIHEKDSLNKTLWTLMCGEVIKYITTAPYTFMPGLLVFSELLPLPLPIQTCDDLSKEELSWAVNLRKLWSAHLHPHGNSIQEFVNRICTTSHQTLLNLLRRVCVQLSDLAANSAIMIARGVLDAIHNMIGQKEDTKVQPCSGNLARTLNFLACLVTHSTLKCAVLQLIHNQNINTIKGDDKYPTIIPAFAQVLKLNDSLNTHVQSQECILSIIQSFCDTEITLLQQNQLDGNKCEIKSDVYLANALPSKDLLLLFINIMIDHLQAENSFVTYLPIVRTFLLLTEHDYGFYHLRENLNRKNDLFLNLLDRLANDFSKDNAECLSTLNTLVELLRVCTAVEEVEGPLLFAPRSIKMSLDEIRSLVGWKTDENGEEKCQHSLISLEEHLKKTVQEDNTFDSLLEGLTGIIKLLNTGSSTDNKEIYLEPILPPPEPLLNQFAGRTIFSSTDAVDERLTSQYWLSAPNSEGENDIENIAVDLFEVCKQHLPADFNLIREVEKLCRVCSSDSSEQNDVKEKKADSQKDKMKRPFITPSRGRGFPRTMPQRSDLFRSRPPNTSRPPSLHVDDFVALETCGAQPTGPTGYNKISRELLATSRVSRGSRGRAFVTSERAVQYRQIKKIPLSRSWWGAGPTRSPYQ